MKITSVNNEHVAYLAKLKMKKYRDLEHLFIVEGPNLVEEALKKGVVKEIISLEEASYPVPVTVVTYEIMKRLTSLINPPKIMAVCGYILPDDIRGNVLILDRIQDPGNLGTIIRSAVAFNFNTIIVSSDTVDVYNDKVIRASEGMIFNINMIKGYLPDMITLLKSRGYRIVGTDVNDGKDIRELKKYKSAFVIGNEGSGVSSEVKKLCNAFCYIPMSNKCESLNAAVASSIIMYEVSRD